jgi:transposase-like protein
MIQRTGGVLILKLENAKHVTIGPLIQEMIAEGSAVYTDKQITT